MTLSRVRLPYPPRSLGPERSGIALIGAIGVVVMVGVFATTIIAFHLATGRKIDQSHRRRQVEHLARAGIEFALGALLAGREGEIRETYQPMENCEVISHVVPDEEQPDIVRISIQATLERENRKPIVVEITRLYRLIRNDGGTLERCEFVSSEFK